MLCSEYEADGSNAELDITFHYPALVIWAVSVQIASEQSVETHAISQMTFVTPALSADTLDAVSVEAIDGILSSLPDLEVIVVVPAGDEPCPGQEELRATLEVDIPRRMDGLQRAGKLSVVFSDESGTSTNSWNDFLRSD